MVEMHHDGTVGNCSRETLARPQSPNKLLRADIKAALFVAVALSDAAVGLSMLSGTLGGRFQRSLTCSIKAASLLFLIKNGNRGRGFVRGHITNTYTPRSKCDIFEQRHLLTREPDSIAQRAWTETQRKSLVRDLAIGNN